MYIFVTENISFANFFEDTQSFPYNVNNNILSVFQLDIQVYVN